METIKINEKKIKKLCDLGLKGKYAIAPREISLPLTNICNCHCIMCHACDKTYENHTYYNELPSNMSLEEYKRIIKPQKKELKDIFRKPKSDYHFVFGTAETLINKDAYEIFKYTKEIYPNCTIRLISNGTIPPHPEDIVKYVDHIGFSIDGCTKETFEMLRTPAKFDHVMDTIKKWDDAASKYNDKFSFGFGTVISTANIHEMSGIVRLAGTFKHIDSVYVQPIIIHEKKAHLNYLLLRNLKKEEIIKYINETKEVSKEVGVRVDAIDSISEQDYMEKDLSIENSRFCRYPWNGIVSYDRKGSLRYFCCYMSLDNIEKLMKKYNIPNDCSTKDMYNSKEFWRFRKDLIEGKLIEYCKGCTQCNTSYSVLKENEVDMESYFYF